MTSTGSFEKPWVKKSTSMKKRPAISPNTRSPNQGPREDETIILKTALKRGSSGNSFVTMKYRESYDGVFNSLVLKSMIFTEQVLLWRQYARLCKTRDTLGVYIRDVKKIGD